MGKWCCASRRQCLLLLSFILLLWLILARFLDPTVYLLIKQGAHKSISWIYWNIYVCCILCFSFCSWSIYRFKIKPNQCSSVHCLCITIQEDNIQTCSFQAKNNDSQHTPFVQNTYVFLIPNIIAAAGSLFTLPETISFVFTQSSHNMKSIFIDLWCTSRYCYSFGRYYYSKYVKMTNIMISLMQKMQQWWELHHSYIIAQALNATIYHWYKFKWFRYSW